MSLPPSSNAAWRILPATWVPALLLAAYVTSFAQRQLPATLAEPMTRQFDLADGELGALIGYGFGFLYALLAVPAGWLVDSMSRQRLLAIGLALAGLATLASAFVASLTPLVVLRLVTGAGQSILVPAAYSLLGEMVPRERIGRAVAGFAIGPFLGAGAMLVLGGRLAALGDWWLAYAVAGVFGIAIAATVLLIDEPTRSPTPQATGLAAYAMRHWAPVLYIDAALTFAAMAGHAILAWSATWLSRSHGLSTADATFAFGITVLVGGIAGTIAAGAGGDALLRRWPAVSRLALLASAMFVATLFALAVFASHALPVALTGLTLLVALIAAALTLAPASLQEITPPGMRGRQHGIAILLVNWIGLGLGPLLIGLASDVAGDARAVGRIMAVAVPMMLFLSAMFATLGIPALARSRKRIPQESAPGLPSSTV